MRFFIYTAIDYYQCHRSMEQLEESHTQTLILDTKYKKPDLNEVSKNQSHLLKYYGGYLKRYYCSANKLCRSMW